MANPLEVSSGFKPMFYAYEHNRGNGATAFTFHDPEEHLTAYKDTVISITPLVAVTQANRWRADGETDPHDKLIDVERGQLALGHFTDDELANEAFMNYDVIPSIDKVLNRTAKMPIVYMTAVKERIRWLSRRLYAVALKKRQMRDRLMTFNKQKFAEEMFEAMHLHGAQHGDIAAGITMVDRMIQRILRD